LANGSKIVIELISMTYGTVDENHLQAARALHYTGPTLHVTLIVRTMSETQLHFNPPGRIATAINRFFGWLTALGLGPSYCYRLQVAGRKSGKKYSTPVNVLVYGGKSYLVGTRGHTQWSRNAKVVGTVTLQRG